MDLPQLPTWLAGLAIGLFVAARRLKAMRPAAPEKFWERKQVRAAERKVRKLDRGPPDLNRLHQAVLIIAEAVGKSPEDLKLAEEPAPALSMRHQYGAKWVTIEDGVYRLTETHCADMSSLRYACLEPLAWQLVTGMPFLPRHQAAAWSRIKANFLPLTALGKESAKEFVTENDIIRRRT